MGYYSTHPHLQTTEGALKGGRPGLVPGRDLFFTWLQLNYSRQLDWSLPLRTTLLAADPPPADSPCSTHTCTLETYLTVPSSSPDSWPSLNFVRIKVSSPASPCSLEGFLPLLLLIAVDYCDHLVRLTFRRSHNLSCVVAESLWAWWCSWSAKIKWERSITWLPSCQWVSLNASVAASNMSTRLKREFLDVYQETIFSRLHLDRARVNVVFCVYWMWQATNVCLSLRILNICFWQFIKAGTCKNQTCNFLVKTALINKTMSCCIQSTDRAISNKL